MLSENLLYRDRGVFSRKRPLVVVFLVTSNGSEYSVARIGFIIRK